jgi:hypothetical protein
MRSYGDLDYHFPAPAFWAVWVRVHPDLMSLTHYIARPDTHVIHSHDSPNVFALRRDCALKHCTLSFPPPSGKQFTRTYHTMSYVMLPRSSQAIPQTETERIAANQNATHPANVSCRHRSCMIIYDRTRYDPLPNDRNHPMSLVPRWPGKRECGAHM